MEDKEKIHYISLKEANEIDTSKLAYLTLNDGTVLLVNNDSNKNNSQKNIIIDDLQFEEINNSEGEESEQNNEEEKQQNQEDNEEQIQSEYRHYIQNNNEELNYSSQGQSKYNQEIFENKPYLCNCNNNNKQIISSNTENNYNNLIDEQEPKNYKYKIIEAIPVKFCYIEDAHLVNQNTNNQTNSKQHYNNNTYVVEISKRDTFSNYQITQSSRNSNEENMNIFKINKELKCNCPLGKRQFSKKEENKNNEFRCNCLKRDGQMECCCPIGNPKMREIMNIASPEVAQQYYKIKGYHGYKNK